MSKILDAIEAHQTGRRFQKRIPTSAVRVEQQVGPVGSSVTLSEYDMRVTIGVKVRLEYPWTADERVKERARAYLAQHIFGEFAYLIEEARMAAYNCDYEKALENLSEIERRMFGR